jgi:GTP cyclohydrolase I
MSSKNVQSREFYAEAAQGQFRNCQSRVNKFMETACKAPSQHSLSLSEKEKTERIEHYFAEIMLTLGLDLNNESLKNTPRRYAKMLVQEFSEGLDPQKFPVLTVQKNDFRYNQMVLSLNIGIHSICEHHFVPFFGRCHIAYFPKDRIIGLSKLNRIVRYFSRRPQLQERLTRQIQETLVSALQTPNVAVVIDAAHLCIRMRGIEDPHAEARTMAFGGCFENSSCRQELFTSLPARGGV